MANSLDTLIQNAVLRATGYANDTSVLTDQLQDYIGSTSVSIDVPGDGTDALTVDPAFPVYSDGEPQKPVVGMPATSFATAENTFNDWRYCQNRELSLLPCRFLNKHTATALIR